MIRVLHPAEEPLRLGALAGILRTAGATALRAWHPERCDIYACAQRAWRAANIPVPYASITQELRAVVPNGEGLMDFNDTAGLTRQEVADLFTRAHQRVCRMMADPPAEAFAGPEGSTRPACDPEMLNNLPVGA